MSITITDPATWQAVHIEKLTANIEGNFESALGKDPAIPYRCSTESQKMWPLFVKITIEGYLDSKKEGRLRITAISHYTIEKGASLTNSGGFTIFLKREATGDKLGGYAMHDHIAALFRQHGSKLSPRIISSVKAEILKAQRAEEEASGAHAARARVAKMTAAQLVKQK